MRIYGDEVVLVGCFAVFADELVLVSCFAVFGVEALFDEPKHYLLNDVVE